MPLTYQRSPFFLCTPKSQTHADFATYRHSKVHEVGENRKGRSSTKRAGLQPSINRHHSTSLHSLLFFAVLISRAFSWAGQTSEKANRHVRAAKECISALVLVWSLCADLLRLQENVHSYIRPSALAVLGIIIVL